MAENLWGARQGEIRDWTTYESAFDAYFLGDIGQMKGERAMKEAVFEVMLDKYGLDGKRIYPGRIFEEAEGKDLDRDRERTAKRVTDSPVEYIKQGARNIDLAGYDTKRQKSEYNTLGFVDGAIVYARRVETPGGGVEYRDRRGRKVDVRRIR